MGNFHLSWRHPIIDSSFGLERESLESTTVFHALTGPVGRYNGLSGKTALADCAACPAGTFFFVSNISLPSLVLYRLACATSPTWVG